MSDCLAWYSILLGKMALYGVLWLSISMVWYGMVWFGMVWYGSVMAWYSMVWHGMTWRSIM